MLTRAVGPLPNLLLVYCNVDMYMMLVPIMWLHTGCHMFLRTALRSEEDENKDIIKLTEQSTNRHL